MHDLSGLHLTRSGGSLNKHLMAYVRTSCCAPASPLSSCRPSSAAPGCQVISGRRDTPSWRWAADTSRAAAAGTFWTYSNNIMGQALPV